MMFEFKIDDECLFIERQDLMSSLESLKSLLERVKKHQRIRSENLGICKNWESDFSYDLVLHYGSQWPKSAHPGEPSEYPIPRDYLGQALWQDEQKDLRIDLMEHILSNLNEVLEDM